MYLITKVETDTPATPVAITTLNQTLVSIATNESQDEMVLVQAMVEIRTTGTSNAGTQDIPISITIGGTSKSFNFRSSAVVGRRSHMVQFSSISRLKDTITIRALGAAAADAQTTVTVNSVYVYGINT